MPRSRSVDNRSAVAFCNGDGCESIAIAKGLCRKHYQAVYRGVHGRPDLLPVPKEKLPIATPETGVDADGQWKPTPGQLRAIPWLVEGLPYAAVAREAECDPRSVAYWMQIPQMRRRVAELRQARIAELEPALGTLMQRAADVVLDALDPDGAIDERARYRAELAERILGQSAFKLLRARLRDQERDKQQKQDRTA